MNLCSVDVPTYARGPSPPAGTTADKVQELPLVLPASLSLSLTRTHMRAHFQKTPEDIGETIKGLGRVNIPTRLQCNEREKPTGIRSPLSAAARAATSMFVWFLLR